MEDLRVIRGQDNRLTSVSEKIEYEHLVRRFHEEEEQKNLKHLLFGVGRLSPSEQDKKD